MDRVIHGFRIISKNPLPEIQAEGIFARHEKTGLEVYHIFNTDEENFFAFAFMTPPENNSGVAHILEHSVFCGSKHYPQKDPFLTLSKQSIHTFLNAMTFPDKTVYPASSIIEADYFNLMAVYGDAVFFPLLKPDVFCQEGVRLEYDGNGTPYFSGVVLNEMRGAYNGFEAAMDRWSRRSLFQNTVYEYDSGGYPPEIPTLTYTDFLAFHKKYYHPANCKVFLYGNIPMEKQLAFIDARFLSAFQPAKKLPLIPPIPIRTEPQKFSVSAPAGTGKNTEKISAMINWLLPESGTIDALMDFILLETVLLGHDGAPLQKRLLETPLAEDVYLYNGLHTELKNSYFTIGLTDLEKHTEPEFEAFVFAALQEIIDEGISKDNIETALHTFDFANREIIRTGGPFALIFMRRCLRGWIHGGNPEDSLRVIPAFERLKKRIQQTPYYLEQLIQTYLLQNKHRSIVTVQHDPHFSASIDTQLEQLAKQAAKQPSGIPMQTYPSQNVSFVTASSDFTAMPSSETAHIPHISKDDLPPLSKPIDQTLSYIDAVPVIFHEQPTNDITYIDIALPIHDFSEQEYELLPLYCAAFAAVGTTDKSWQQISELLSKFTGGFSATPITVTRTAADFSDIPFTPPQHIAARDWVLLRSKMLPDCLEDACRTIFSYMQKLSFSDDKRLRDIFIQLKNDMDSLPGYAGHRLASLHAEHTFSLSRHIENIWAGVPQIRFLREWYTKMETQPDCISDLAQSLAAVHKKILRSGILVKLCGTQQCLDRIKPLLAAHVSAFSAPSPAKAEALIPPVVTERLTFFPSTVQVGFAALAIPLTCSMESFSTALVYAQLLETEILWDPVRVEGGAYGVSAYYDVYAHIFAITTFRDPNPQKSLCEIVKALTALDCSALSESDFEALIIGTYGTLLQPQTPAQKSAGAFFRLLNGIPCSLKDTIAAGILCCTPAKLRSFAQTLSAALPHSHACCVGSSALLQENTELTAYFGKPKTKAAV